MTNATISKVSYFAFTMAVYENFFKHLEEIRKCVKTDTAEKDEIYQS